MSSPVPYATVLTPMRVPLGHFPIEIVQYWRGERAPGQPFPLHWAIFVRTAGSIGNYYHVLGNIDTFSVAIERNIQQTIRGSWRGSHIVGFVAPHHLAALENALYRVPVVRYDPSWNTQKWVHEALRTLRSLNFFVDPEVTMAKLQTQMACLIEAWENGEI